MLSQKGLLRTKLDIYFSILDHSINIYISSRYNAHHSIVLDSFYPNA